MEKEEKQSPEGEKQPTNTSSNTSFNEMENKYVLDEAMKLFNEATQNDGSLTLSKFLLNVDTLVYAILEKTTKINNITFEKVKVIINNRLLTDTEETDIPTEVKNEPAEVSHSTSSSSSSSQPSPAPQVLLPRFFAAATNINLSEAEQVEVALALNSDELSGINLEDVELAVALSSSSSSVNMTAPSTVAGEYQQEYKSLFAEDIELAIALSTSLTSDNQHTEDLSRTVELTTEDNTGIELAGQGGGGQNM